MAEISAQLVQTLRERTSAAIMDCKRALVASNGDIEAAVEAMRKAGQAKADKKADRTVAEGIVVAQKSADEKTAVLVDINCETDFVARGDDFKQFAELAAATALTQQIDNPDTLLNAQTTSKESVDALRRHLVAKIGENIQIRRVAFMRSEGCVGTYVHGGRIGVLVDLASANPALAKDMAMHIAASNPHVVTPDQVSKEAVEKERVIYKAQAESSGKPANIIEKMVQGRIEKFLNEVSLVGQPFVKNPDQTVGQLLSDHKTHVVRFVRFAVGEGIEKKADDFVAEVMAQARGA